MNKQRNHTLAVEKLYAKRKHRSSTASKAHMPEFRAIAEKTNVHNKLTVVDRNGNVIIQKMDKDTKGTKVDNAMKLGKEVAIELIKKKVERLTFDRNGFRYIGRVKAMCDGLREGGIIV